MTRSEVWPLSSIVLVACLLIGFPNIAMAVIAVFANITAIQRLLFMKKNLD